MKVLFSHFLVKIFHENQTQSISRNYKFVSILIVYCVMYIYYRTKLSKDIYKLYEYYFNWFKRSFIISMFIKYTIKKETFRLVYNFVKKKFRNSFLVKHSFTVFWY